MASRLAAIAVLMATLSVTSARAEALPEPVEGWRYPAAVGAGAGVQLVAGGLSLLAFTIDSHHEDTVSISPVGATAGLVLLTVATPALSSFLVWTITGRHGSYLPIFLGGVLGACMAMPLILASDNRVLFAAGQILLPPIVETIVAGQSAPAAPSWNPPASSPLMGLERGELPRATVGLAAPIFRVSLP